MNRQTARDIATCLVIAVIGGCYLSATAIDSRDLRIHPVDQESRVHRGPQKGVHHIWWQALEASVCQFADR